MIFIDTLPASAIIGRYEGIYVALSFLIAAMASYVALDFALQLRREESPLLRRYWQFGGAALIGAGIWCMHFTGMLAYNMGMEHKYEVGMTLLSLALPIIFAYAIFQIIKTPDLKTSTILMASPILGLSILSMHYTGMQAMQMPIDLMYQPGWFVVSVLIAMFTSAAALWLMFIYAHRRESSRIPFHMLSAIVMGLGICGMHYSGMEAAVIVPKPDCIVDPAFADRPLILAIAIAVTTILIFAIAIGALRITEVMARHLRDQVKKRTEELVTVNHDLVRAKETAESASIAKSEFLANMSHEIRTPMNAIIGITNILRNNMVGPDKRDEFLETLQVSSESLMALLNEILDISKIEANKIQIENIEFNLKELIEEIIAVISIRANEKSLPIVLHYDETMETKFIGDPLRIRQILVNLLSNAVKFTHQGSVDLQVKFEDYTENKNPRPVEIHIQDTGVGIAEDKIKTIFEKFMQEDASTTRKFGGTGLGLSICKALAEKMGGYIDVSSIVGQGSLFVVNLPLESQTRVQKKTATRRAKKISDEALALQADTRHGLEKLDRNKPCVLLVEDSEPNIMVATSYLDSLGYVYEVATNGREALGLYRTQKFAVILMDIQMPELDGFDVARAIREQERREEKSPVPIIALTSFATQHDREKCLRHGMDDYISKPFRIEELQGKLEYYIYEKNFDILPDRLN